ncbi:uncharacterized protein LOC103573774 isoform X2 [Microplitis demolitor]|uniref:uncharacterized protein LOC103573774 isoform X2 n=1 Tax=Microplitis demolitor TaxID=69319 RepID=UPI0004CDB612|nr:uncharacterized protein LOC103573774 isoform X2 [Microplitis demolitor]
MIKLLLLFSAMNLAYSAQNDQLIGSWGPNVRPTGKQSPNEQSTENTSPDKEILNGWMVKVKYHKYFRYHYGFFIEPRVFLTSSWNVDSISDIKSIDVSNDLHNSWPDNRSLHVDFQNIYFGMELSKRPNNSQRDCAVLITDQPVIPAFKITENTFIEVVSDINDVNLTKCFIQASNTSTMSFYDCHLENAGTLSNTDRFFECSVDGGQKDVSLD